MKQITPDRYVHGVLSIYEEQPKYRTGGDGSDGTCDCIGMGRGALKREGVTDVKGMNGTNYAARHTVKNLQALKKESQLMIGDVVFKTRDKDDKNMRLPDQYRKNGSDYDKTWGETNFTHYGTVIQVNPIRICHMTSPTAKIDESIKGWGYFGQLPWVSADADIPVERPPAEWATVWADSGKTVKMRQKPSTLCRIYWEVPIGAEVVLVEPGETWSGIIWAGRSGYMMTKFLRTGETKYTVTIRGLDKETAEELIAIYSGEMTAE